MNSNERRKILESFASNVGSRALSRVTNLFKEDSGKKADLIGRLADLYKKINDVESKLTKTSTLDEFPTAYYGWVNFLTFFDMNVLGFLDIKKSEQEPTTVKLQAKDNFAIASSLLNFITDKTTKNKVKAALSVYKIDSSDDKLDSIVNLFNQYFNTDEQSLSAISKFVSGDYKEPEIKVDSSKRNNAILTQILPLIMERDVRLKIKALIGAYKLDHSEENLSKLIVELNAYFGTNGYTLEEILQSVADKDIPDRIIEEKALSNEKIQLAITKSNVQAAQSLLNFISDKFEKNKISSAIARYRLENNEENLNKIVEAFNEKFDTKYESLSDILSFVSDNYKLPNNESDKANEILNTIVESNIEDAKLLVQFVSDPNFKIKLKSAMSIYEDSKKKEDLDNVISTFNECFQINKESLYDILDYFANEFIPENNEAIQLAPVVDNKKENIDYARSLIRVVSKETDKVRAEAALGLYRTSGSDKDLQKLISIFNSTFEIEMNSLAEIVEFISDNYEEETFDQDNYKKRTSEIAEAISRLAPRQVKAQLKSYILLYKIGTYTENELLRAFNGELGLKYDTLELMLKNMTLGAKNPSKKELAILRQIINSIDKSKYQGEINILRQFAAQFDKEEKQTILDSALKLLNERVFNSNYESLYDLLNSIKEENIRKLDIDKGTKPSMEAVHEPKFEVRAPIQVDKDFHNKIINECKALIEKMIPFINDNQKTDLIELLGMFEVSARPADFQDFIDMCNEYLNTDYDNIEQLYDYVTTIKTAKKDFSRWLNRFKLSLFDNEVKVAKRDLANLLNDTSKNLDQLMNYLEKRSTSIEYSIPALKDLISDIIKVNSKFIEIGMAYNSHAKLTPEKTDKQISEIEFSRMKRISTKLTELL